MAIYHFSGTIISRSQGRSVVACAAYRSAEILYDEKYGKEHDYSKKEDVVFKEILLPESAPDWMKNREKLWNEVEKNERRKDAQLAREFNFSLPRELTLEQNIELAREFVQTAFVDQGMIADLCIHDDKASDGQSQIHAHVMLTMREVDKEGFGRKVRKWNEKERLLEWRELWAITANKYLEMHDIDVKIDHRSFEAQGIELEPQHKIGPNAAKERMARMEDHLRIARENGEKLLSDPSIALDAITRQQSTFTHHDLARFVNRHTVDDEQFQKVFEVVKASPEMIFLGLDEKGRERFTTQEMLDIETNMLVQAELLKKNERHRVSNKALDDAVKQRTLSREQVDALVHIVDKEHLTSVVGYAGTGKSYLLDAARDVWERSGYRVFGAALSGIAAQNLEQSSGISSRTVASFLHRWEKGRDELSTGDVLVIDEAGMLGSRQMDRLLSHASDEGAKVVLVGDFQQLQAIEAGAPFRVIAKEHKYAELNQVRRQVHDWQKEATMDFAKGRVSSALAKYDQRDHIHLFSTQGDAKANLMQQWQDVRINNPKDTQIILAYTRSDVKELNDLARQFKRQDGELLNEGVFKTIKGDKSFAIGDRVYFLKRDDGLGVVNGTLGTVKGTDEVRGTLEVLLDRNDRMPSDRSVLVDTNFYQHIDHGYAATVYKSQGVTVDRTYLLASKHYDAHSTYVGMSRHRQSCDIYYSREEFSKDRELQYVLGRDRSKEATSDYLNIEKEYGLNRSVRSVDEMEKERKEIAQYDLKTKPKVFNGMVIQPHEGLIDFERLRKEREKEQRAQIKAFKEDYAKRNPEKARELEYAIMPKHEKMAVDALKQIKALEMEIKKSTYPRYDQEKLEKYASELAKNPHVMHYIHKHGQEVGKKVEGLAKQYERSLDRGISY